MTKRTLLLLALISCLCAFSQQAITLRYIGNMGVLVGTNDNHVLIDALHQKYGDDYLFPPKKLIDKVTLGQDGYPIADALLFTHMHGDHFHGEPCADFIKYHPKTFLFGPSQVTASIKGYDDSLITVENTYQKQTVKVGDMTITGFKMNHSGSHISTQNIGYIINFGQKKILHIGDSDWYESIQLFEKLKLKEQQIDVAILPYWMMDRFDAKALLKKNLSPKKLVLAHISPKATNKWIAELQERNPKAILLTQQEQIVIFE